MKGVVVYVTSRGNTKKIAETMAETLRESGIEVEPLFVDLLNFFVPFHCVHFHVSVP